MRPTSVALLAVVMTLSHAGLAASAEPRRPVFDGWRNTTEAVGARDTDRIAWIDQQGSATTLYAAAAPDYRPVKIVASSANDGIPVEGLSISPDGHWLAFDRGGAGDASGAGDLGLRGVWVARADGALCRIADGVRPTLSNGSDRLAWLSQGRLLATSLSEDCAVMRAGISVVATDGAFAPVWSPDGHALAFEQLQQRARRIGVWNGSALSWIDNGGKLDVAPAWSADGAKLAFLRIDPSSDDIANQYDEDPPARVSLMLADVTNLSARTVWASPGEDGFARQWRSRSTAPVMWLDDRTLAFLSEHDGWQHFYSTKLDGQAALRDLTPGACETEYGEVAGSTLITSDACQQVDLRRLVRTDLQTGARTVLSPSGVVAIQPVAFDHGRRLLWRQSVDQVLTLQVMTNKGPRAVERGPQDPFPSVRTDSVSFTASDGIKLNTQMFSIGGVRNRRPAVIFLHGGPQQQTLAGASPSSFYARFGWMNRALAAKGYVVLSVNYRSGRGQGRDFRRIRGVARSGAGELLDVQAARDWLAKRPDIDPTKIAVWGDSWGGWLAALALAKHSDLFAGGVVISGVYDLSETSFGPTLDPQAKALAKQSSAAAWIDQWRSPVLIIHGEKDYTVPYAQGAEMAAALRARGRDVQLLSYPREGHVFQIERDWNTLYEASAAFFEHLFSGRRDPIPGDSVR